MQLAALTDDQLRALETTDMAVLGNGPPLHFQAQYGVFSEEQIGALKTAQIKSLETATLNAMDLHALDFHAGGCIDFEAMLMYWASLLSDWLLKISQVYRRRQIKTLSTSVIAELHGDVLQALGNKALCCHDHGASVCPCG